MNVKNQMDQLEQQIQEAQQRYSRAQGWLNEENQRTNENMKRAISISRKIQACREKLRETNEACRTKAEKLQLAYKNIEFHGLIVEIREGLKRAIELTSRAERKMVKVAHELESMNEERLNETGIDNNNNAKEFGEMETFGSRRAPLEALRNEFFDSQLKEFLILRKKVDAINTEIEIVDDKFAVLEARKQELQAEIHEYKTKKRDLLKAKANKENLHSTNLRLFLVELGVI